MLSLTNILIHQVMVEDNNNSKYEKKQ